MALLEGNLNDCTTGDQSSVTPIMEVADGGTVKNVIFSAHIGDGIHCLGSCTIDNVWFNYICDDALTCSARGRTPSSAPARERSQAGALCEQRTVRALSRCHHRRAPRIGERRYRHDDRHHQYPVHQRVGMGERRRGQVLRLRDKPGDYQASSGWFVWDCQSQWW